MIKNSPSYLSNVHQKVAVINDCVLLFHAILCIILSCFSKIWLPTVISILLVGSLWFTAVFIIKKKLGSKFLAALELAIFMQTILLITPTNINVEYLFMINFVLLIFYEDWRVIVSFALISLIFLNLFYIISHTYHHSDFRLLTNRLENNYYIINHSIFIIISGIVCCWRAVVVKRNQEQLITSKNIIIEQYEVILENENILTEKIAQLESITLNLNLVNQELNNLTAIVEKTSNAVVITDNEGMTTWVNKSFETITGFELHEIKGKKPGKILQGKSTDAEASMRIKKAFDDKKAITEEVLNYTKNGIPFWSVVTITPVLDNKGDVTNFISVQVDITEKKNHQQRLEEYVFLNSHILRGSMCRVSGLAYLLSNNLAIDEFDLIIQKLIESISEFDNTTKLINQILEDNEYAEGKYAHLLSEYKFENS